MKLKKLFAFVMAMAMILSTLAACGNNDAATKETTKPSNTGTVAETEGTVAAEPGKVTLPIVDEPMTIKVMMPLDTSMVGVITSYNDCEFYKNLAERTGITIEFESPASGSEAQTYQLMYASGELPHVVVCSYMDSLVYPDGDTAGVEDGLFLDLTDLIPQYMPNYYAYIQEDPELYRQIVSEDGRMVPICSANANHERHLTYGGFYVRKDWLDAAGLDVPVTFDDWTEMLKVFKEEFGADKALGMLQSGHFIGACFSFALGGSNTYMIDLETDQIKYGPITEGWKEYLTIMNEWFEAGYMDPDYVGNGLFYFPEMADIVSGETGAFMSLYTMQEVYEQGIGEGAELVPVPMPVLNEGDVNRGGTKSGKAAGARMYITTTCTEEEAIAIMKMYDYFFTEEGTLFANYGVEGDTYTMVDGEPVYTDKILNNPDGYTFSQAQSYYTMPGGVNPLQVISRNFQSVSQEAVDCMQIWDCTTQETALPIGLSFSTEDNNEMAVLTTDIQSYVDEMTNKFITGAVSIEEEWDTYVANVQGMKLDRVLELYQISYEKYMSK